MLNKQKIIKLFIFSVVIFTLLLNLVNLSYSEDYRINYAMHNAQVISEYYGAHWHNSKNKITEKEVCLNFKPSLFLPTHNTLNHWSGLMIWISILIMAVVKITGKISKRKIFSKKEKYILLSAIFLSFSIYYFYLGLMELNYHYFGFGCSRFLL